MIVHFKKRLYSLSPPKLIVTFYFLAVTVSFLLLSLPFARKPGVEWSFIDAFFTAVSAVSVTGLTVVNTADTFSVAGTFILAFVLQIGGIGVMTLGTFIWILFGKKIGLQERRLIMLDQNQSKLSGLVNLLRQILVLILTIEFVGAVILSIYYLNYFPSWQEAFLQGFFASVSATTNAGFDITGSSLVPFANDYFVQIVNIVLLTLGAIGFPVLIEVKNYFKSKQEHNQYRFSLYTKLTSVTYFGLLIFGTISILILEYNKFFATKSWHESYFYALFQAATTRSAGLSTMDVNLFSEPTLLLLCFLMFIGASPSSVGGGIRTTTFAIVLLTMFHFARGSRTVKVFRRELHQEDMIKALVVTLVAFFLWFTAIVILTITEPFQLMEILFEVSSAFGTVGLSMGITPDLTTFGKIVIMTLMFIGRIGILSFLYLLGRREIEANYHYPKERVIIG
ncbi:TrkH family potassium uptake protein [Bacillus sp. FJAT-47783]|uniref:TrkH family potassium uptake protein n=1 Tax=Bacillus sp. FJAT-47783 TaxID=2922712 RepID=UPI001FAB9931|nr:TrkH family potassium uptake protein [Bacillus sp. FJAT-47783]